MVLEEQKLRSTIIDTLGKSASQLDDTVIDYLCGVLADGALNDEEEACSVLGPFLEGALSESETTRFCKTIFGLTSSHAPVKQPELSQLAKPISIKSQLTVEEDKPDWARPQEDKLVEVDLRKLQSVEQKRQQRKTAKLEREERKKNSVNASLAALKAMQQQQEMVVVHSDTSNRVKDIKIENFTMSFGKDVLLTNASVTFAHGRRYGIVGRNGCGKSTLLRHIAARETGGVPALLSILHVEQEVVGDDTTALQSVLDSDVERSRLLAEEKRILALQETTGAQTDRLVKIAKRLEEIDAHSAESRAASILAGLGFTQAMQEQETKHFSGGWRMRIALARALFCRPDVLILDEPTNHLDLFATLWLENYLQSWPGTLIIVSHQRDFLNSVSTDTIHLHNKELEAYRGNYDAFEDARCERMRQQAAQASANQIRRKHVQAFIDRFRYNAKRASLVQSRIKALEKMQVIEEALDDPTLVIQFPDPNPLTPPILQFCDVSFGYTPERILFSDLNIGIDLDSRVALVGANGAGKSTLLKLLTGELEPTTGHIVRHSKLVQASFSQHFVEQLDLTISPLQTFQKVYGENLPVQTIRNHLGSFGLSGDLAIRTINTLSGGQKCRVVFAIMAWRRPHVLLLDEPTNHLDMETIDSLAQALLAYKGGVLMVSHDERLISLVCDQLWYFDGNGGVKTFDGDFKAYKKSLLAEDGLLTA